MGRKIKGIVNDEGRTCNKCGEFKVWEEFSKDKSRTRGKNNQCKGCVKQYNKQYREENRDVIAEYQKQYREENCEAIAEKKKQWYEENKDVIIERKKQYYEENRDDIAEKQRQYNEENRDAVLVQKKQYYISPANYETYKDELTPLESPRESKDGYLEVKCATCGGYFTPINLQVRSRVRSLSGSVSGENRLYCSDACKESCSVFGRRKYPKGFKKPNNREYQPEFRTMILERDNYTCQVCNKQFDKKHLQAHHITPVVCSPMEQVDIENGICVCKECHINLHLTQEGITYAELIKVGKSTNEDNSNNDKED